MNQAAVVRDLAAKWGGLTGHPPLIISVQAGRPPSLVAMFELVNLDVLALPSVVGAAGGYPRADHTESMILNA
jgi:hypothetical protein